MNINFNDPTLKSTFVLLQAGYQTQKNTIMNISENSYVPMQMKQAEEPISHLILNKMF